ncbi:sensor histidine kinase [Streptomyces sp. A7024]|uniref:histidine kinase n=1 Tax=Streptomyces coryli TaxID=1128680 RepID=A0A6G4U5E2_9ACTN|nr:sensor histidine kinase [Streptomyces coryli]NGN67459.1 sensor histidine kinase [Streptomyces coryli]
MDARGDGRMDVTQAPTQPVYAATRRVWAFDARHPWVWDAAVPAVIAAPGLLQVLGVFDTRSGELRREGTARYLSDVPTPVLWLVLAGLVLPLLWRRRHPFAAYCAVAVALTVHDAYQLALVSAVAIGAALFSVALRQPLSRIAWAAAVVLAGLAFDLLHNPPADPLREYIPVLAIFTAIVTTAFTMRTRREHIGALEERARRLEVERDQKARLATAAERARIAREMHDIVAHNLAVIVGLADGGSYAATKSPERQTQALDAISTTGREALAELRRLLGVLQPPEAELAPQPGLPDLDALLDRVRAAGLPVRCRVRGDARALSEGEQLTVYRIVQEALTNTLKHAKARESAQVTLAYDEGVTIEVTDTGAAPAAPPSDTGQGLAGMRERVALYGGTFDAGPTGTGWRVRATIPSAGAGDIIKPVRRPRTSARSAGNPAT